MHDAVWFEIQGKPSVFIASTGFVDAAEAQAAALGLSDVRRVFVPHPIQDATDDELRAKADAIIDELIDALVERNGAPDAVGASARPLEAVRP